MRTAALLMIVASCIYACAQASSAVITAVEQLENARQGSSVTECEKSVAIIREAGVPDRLVWDRLWRIVEDPTRLLRLRLMVLDVCLHVADESFACEVLERAVSWVPAAEDVANGTAGHLAQMSFLGPVVGRLCKQWREWERVQVAALPLLERVVLCGAIGARAEAVEALRCSSAAPSARRDVAERIIVAQPKSESIDRRLIPLLDASSVTRFRDILRAALLKQQVHWGILATLSDHGDMEIVSDLTAALPDMRKRSAQQAQLIEGWYLWQIDVQRQPQQLLEFISSDDHKRGAEAHLWAIDRAVERGIPNADIRAAMLDYADATKGILTLSHDGRDFQVPAGLESLKRVGMAWGILKPGDLPNVRTDGTALHP